MINIPQNEYPPYYEKYFGLLEEKPLLTLFEEQTAGTISFIKSLTHEQALHKYAEGKWSVKEVLGHIIDTERVLMERAFRFSRKEEQPLPSFDENSYIANGNWDETSLQDLAELYEAMRRFHIRTISLFREDMFLNKGIANKTEVSVRALLYFALGHELHHLNVIKERYL